MNAALDQLSNLFHDPRTYIETFLSVVDPEAQVRPLRFNYAQKKVMRIREAAIKGGRPRRFIILKARRLGMSTLEQALNFHCVATNPNRKVLTLAHNSGSTEKIFAIPQFFYQTLEPSVRPARLTRHNKRDLNFPILNSLYYVGTAGSHGLGRGETLNRVHWSEVAWFDKDPDEQQNLLAGLTEAASHGEVVLESTPNGIGNLFHELCMEANKGQSEWTLVFLPWWDDPTYQKHLDFNEEMDLRAALTDEEKMLVERHHLSMQQIAWRRAQKKALRGKFAQEYPENPSTCFLVSGSSFFDQTLVAQFLEALPDPAQVKDGGRQIIFKKPVPGRKYVMGCDCAEGNPTSDYSVADVIDFETLEPMAILRGKWKPEDFAQRCDRLGREYNMALIACERNNHGHSVLNSLRNTLHYPDLYHHHDWDAVQKKHVAVIGWPTDGKTRPIMLDDLRAEFEGGRMIVLDRVLLEEMLTFQQNKNGKYEARPGCHDDTVIAKAIAIQARKGMGAKITVPTVAPPPPPARLFQVQSPAIRSGGLFR